jgi:glycosyltransferase involved in cell wall biosynthesis
LIKLRRVRAFTEVYRRIDNILVGSRFIMDLLVRSGIVPDQVSVVPPIFATQPMPEYRPVEESKTVLFGGRLVKEKGLHLLIQALARIPTRWELIVAGDGDERENLALLVDQMGVGDKVRFVGWVRSRDLSDYMSTCTCVAVPSLWPEPFGRMGPEAFMHGRPVVAFSVGGIPDWLEHERSGLLVEPGNVDGLELALRRLLASAELCAQMGHYGRRVARSQWRPQIQVERLLDVFERAQQQFWDRR